MFRCVSACLAPLILAVPALAQGGGFLPGDLFLYTPAVQGAGAGGSLVHVDLAAGAASVFVDFDFGVTVQGSGVWDPYRQRVLFCAGIGIGPTVKHLYAVDAAGTVEDLGHAGPILTSMAPTGDGRIYFRDNSSGFGAAPFQYLDAADVQHTLLDDTGSQPFKIDGNGTFDVRGMIYDAGTNALFVASWQLAPCPGGPADKINVRKLPLSADGTRLAGPVSCAQFEAGAGESPVGWSRGPLGQLMLVEDLGGDLVSPRVMLVDPATLSISAFASPGGYFAAGAVSGGTWSSTLGAALILDSANDKLRAYSAGSSGDGLQLGLSGLISSAGTSGEVASLFEVEPSACQGGWLPYGTGLAGAGGFVPALTGGGCPQAGPVFTLNVAHGVGGGSAALFLGLASAATPFKGGTFLVGALVLNLPLTLGGTPGAPGAGSLTLPAVLPVNPALQGVQLFLQAGVQDAAAVHGVALSNGLRLEIG